MSIKNNEDTENSNPAADSAAEQQQIIRFDYLLQPHTRIRTLNELAL